MGIKSKLGVELLALAAWTLGSPQVGMAQAQGLRLRFGAVPATETAVAADVYKTTYFNIGGYNGTDETVRIVNPTSTPLCALIYVFDSDEELQECCSCGVTPNGYQQLSVATNLTANPLYDGGFDNANCVAGGTCGTIQVISSTSCEAYGTPAPQAGLRLWLVHEEGLVEDGHAKSTSVKAFSDAPLDATEMADLSGPGSASGTPSCLAAVEGGSGNGVCEGCAVPPPPPPPPAPGVVNSSTENTLSSGQTSLQQFLPDATAAGQFMFATVIIQGTGVSSDFIEVPGGWTSLALTSCGTDLLESISYRIAAGSDAAGTSYTWNFCTSSGCTTPVSAVGTGSIANFSGVATGTCSGTPSSGCAIQSGTGAPLCACTTDSTTATAPSITPLIANSLGIAQFGAYGNVALEDAQPSPWISVFEHANTSGPDNRNDWGLLPASPTGTVTSAYGVTDAASDNIGCLVSANPL